MISDIRDTIAVIVGHHTHRQAVSIRIGLIAVGNQWAVVSTVRDTVTIRIGAPTAFTRVAWRGRSDIDQQPSIPSPSSHLVSRAPSGMLYLHHLEGCWRHGNRQQPSPMPSPSVSVHPLAFTWSPAGVFGHESVVILDAITIVIGAPVSIDGIVCRGRWTLIHTVQDAIAVVINTPVNG